MSVLIGAIKALFRMLKRLIATAFVSAPFLGGGGYSWLEEILPQWAAFSLIGVGVFLLMFGTYVSLMSAFPTPALVAGESVLVQRRPSMKPAFARMFMGFPIICVAVYMFGYTMLPYLYPSVILIVGLFYFFKGTMKYLRNLHLSYTVTDRRVVQMYKFLTLNTAELPVGRLISISESRNFFELLTGRGSVIAASGIGRDQTIKMEEIDNPSPVAETLRGLLNAA
tara:strand:- start:1236 stop:1910 length:675 start_codon:yes stop_codon:yes gene_type:complete